MSISKNILKQAGVPTEPVFRFVIGGLIHKERVYIEEAYIRAVSFHESGGISVTVGNYKDMSLKEFLYTYRFKSAEEARSAGQSLLQRRKEEEAFCEYIASRKNELLAAFEAQRGCDE